MTKTSSCCRLLLLSLAGAAAAHALDPNEWRYRQTLTVEAAEIIRIPLPPATLDGARPKLEDLRLLDAAGNELAFRIDRAVPSAPPPALAPRDVRVTLRDGYTEVLLDTGTSDPLAGVTLESPAPSFMKAVRVEVSSDGERWSVLREGVPFFRQHGASQLRLPLNDQPASFIRLTLDDAHTQPAPITGARLVSARKVEAAPVTSLPGARIAQRDEFAEETVLTIDLDARNLPLASVRFDIADALFTRDVTLGFPELRHETVAERLIGRGALYALGPRGGVHVAQRELAAEFSVPHSQLIARIKNSDSPPLQIRSVAVMIRPTWIVFSAPHAGNYTLLTGNPDIRPPTYDLSRLTESFDQLPEARASIGPREENATYARKAALADTPLLGASIDPTLWDFRKPVRMATAGVQQLELDPEVLAGSRPDLGDVRLVNANIQIPYVLEFPGLTRKVQLTVTPANDHRQPNLSRWRLALPRARLPIASLRLTSSTPLFRRSFRIFVMDSASSTGDRTLAFREWSQTPENAEGLFFPLEATPPTDALFIETNNGDNAPIELRTVEATHQVARLLFKAESGPLTLLYGNPEARPPRYDVAMIAQRLLSAERHIAHLGAESGISAPPSSLKGRAVGVIFWGALACVVIGLLAVVAKLLPRSPA